jgi:hypothetical protein
MISGNEPRHAYFKSPNWPALFVADRRLLLACKRSSLLPYRFSSHPGLEKERAYQGPVPAAADGMDLFFLGPLRAIRVVGLSMQLLLHFVSLEV